MSKESALAVATGNPSPESSKTPLESSPLSQSEPAQGVVAPPPQLESEKFSVFAKKEARLVQEQQQVKREKEELAKVKKQIEDFESLRKTDPVGALKQLGFTDTEIYNFLANEQPKERTPEQIAMETAQQELKKFREEQETKEKQQVEQQNKATIDRFKRSISDTIVKNSEKYEYSAFNKEVAEDLAYAVVEETFKESGELITAEEALDLVESYYEDLDNSMNSLKKRQVKLQPPAIKEEIGPKQSTQPQRQQPLGKAITNRMAATSSSQTEIKNESREQKRERLMALIKQGLTK